MKLILFVTLMLIWMILGFLICKACKYENRNAFFVKRMLQIGFIAVVVNMALIYADSSRLRVFEYSIYFVATDWLLYYLFRFSIEYVGNVFEEYVKKRLMLLLLGIDSLSLLLNNMFGHLFHVQRISLLGDNSYYRLIVTPLFYIHYFIILMLVTFSLITLIYKGLKVSTEYRKKYLVLSTAIIVIMTLNICTFKEAIDVSIYGYAVGGICIYYYVLIYFPRNLLSKTLFSVTKEMEIGMVITDFEGKKVYRNQYADVYLCEENPYRDKEGMTLEQFCNEELLQKRRKCSYEKEFYKDGKKIFFRIQFSQLFDENERIQGSYVMLQDYTEDAEKLEAERYIASHDHITGLYNKAYFYDRAEKKMKEQLSSDLLLIYTDIRNFKLINEFYGTEFGNELLRCIGNALRKYMTKEAIYGRLESDHFCILIPKHQLEEDVLLQVSKEAFSSFADEDLISAETNYYGIYEIDDWSLPISTMCDRAKLAINTLKGEYHKQIAYYDDSIRDRVVWEQKLTADLVNAISRNELQMYLQPQVTAEGRFLGAEALVRWEHPSEGLLMPGMFLPVFEKNGLITEVDTYIWECACRQLQAWKKEGKENLYISVNISQRDLHFLNVCEIFVHLVQKYEISPKMIKLEITETSIVENLHHSLECIDKLRKEGFIIEMDDFGSGYSSLSVLKDIQVDVIKIDMAFFESTPNWERSKIILEMIIYLSKRLGIQTIAEGVENSEQVTFLSDIGCDVFQGYYFAKPMTVEQMEERYY